MRTPFKTLLSIILVGLASLGIVLMFMGEQVKEMLNPLVRDILVNLNLEDFEGDLDEYTLAYVNSSTNGVLWLRSHSNGEFDDIKGDFDQNQILTYGHKETTKALSFFADKVAASGAKQEDIWIRVNKNYSVASINKATTIIALDPIYSSFTVDSGTDHNRLRWSEISDDPYFEYETTYYPIYDYQAIQDSVIDDPEWVMAENNYADFVYKNYLGLKNDNVRNELEEYLRENNLSPKEGDFASIMEVKNHFLGDEFVYDAKANLRKNYGQSNSVIEFLYEKKGDYRYFSNALCQLYRAAGIPSRTCSGYIYFVEEGVNTAISFLMLHSWTEVYIRGCGWCKADCSLRKRIVPSEEQAAKEKQEIEANGGVATGLDLDTKIRNNCFNDFKRMLPNMIRYAASQQGIVISDKTIADIQNDDALIRQILAEVIDAYEDGKEPDLTPFIEKYAEEMIKNLPNTLQLEDFYFPDLDTLNQSSVYSYEYQNGYLMRSQINSGISEQVTYADIYKIEEAYPDANPSDEEKRNEWDNVKNKFVEDKRTFMRLYISTNTKKLYKKGKKQSPDWNAYARIDSLTIHTKEIPEELLTALNSSGYRTTSTDSFTYDYTSARANPLTWQSLKKGIDFPAIDGAFTPLVHLDILRGKNTEFELRFEKNACNQEDIGDYSSCCMINCLNRDKIEQTNFYSISDSHGSKDKFQDVTNRYFVISCNDKNGSDFDVTNLAKGGEEGRSDKFSIIENTPENRSSLANAYTLCFESEDIEIKKENLGNLDAILEQNKPKLVFGEMIDESEYYDISTMVNVPAEPGQYRYFYYVNIYNANGDEVNRNYIIHKTYGTITVV